MNVQCASVEDMPQCFVAEKSRQTKCVSCRERIWVSQATIDLAAKIATPENPLRLLCEKCMPARPVRLAP